MMYENRNCGCPPRVNDLTRELRLHTQLEDIHRELIRLKGEINNLRNAVIPQPVERVIKDMDFGEALVWIKEGSQVTRKCWKNAAITVWLWRSEDSKMMNELRVRTVNGQAAPWMPNHTEILADDWELVR